MKVTCDRGALANALNLAGGVVLSRTPKPVLLNVKLTAADGVLTLAATDLEAALHLAVDQVDVQENGEMLLLSDKLSAIVRESADSTLNIHSTKDGAEIRGQDSRYAIFSHSVEDFPPVEPFSGDADFEILAEHLADLVTRTLFATARETSRYAINGVLLEREGKKLTMVATDGRRLAMAKGMAAKANKDKIECIVPSKALALLKQLLDDASETVRVRISNNQAHFATGSATLTTNLVEGNFPPYKDVIPKEHDRKATFATDLLASGVRRAALLTNEESKGVKFSFDGDHLLLSSRAPEMGEAEVNVPVEAYEGDAIEIGFNPQFMTDALKIVDANEVTIEMKAPNKPGTLKVGNDFLYVVMPVSLT